MTGAHRHKARAIAIENANYRAHWLTHVASLGFMLAILAAFQYL